MIGKMFTSTIPVKMQNRTRQIQTLIAVCLVAPFFLPVNALALFGAGDIVSDPGSYSYYVEQIKVATKELEAKKEQLLNEAKIIQEAKAQYDEMVKTKALLEGTYTYAVKTVSKLKNLKDKFEENPTSVVMKYATDFMDGDGDAEAWVSAQDVMKYVFQDPRKKGDGGISEEQARQIKIIEEKYQVRQKMLENAITEAEKVQADMPDRYEKIGKIAEQIDKADTVKKALDINNQFQAEILIAINDLSLLISQLGEAQAAVHFTGVDDEASKQVAADLEATKEASKEYMPQKEFLDKNGVNLEDSANDAIMKMLEN